MQVNSDYDSEEDSDYDPEEDEGFEVASSKTDDVLTREENQESSRIVIQDVPIPEDFCADPCQISVAELEEQIRFHIQNGSLVDTLTKIDLTSKVFCNPKYPPREIQLGKDRYPPRETRFQVIQKTYGNPLHYACRDRNSSRGEQKIRLLLWAANEHKIPIRKLLTLSEVTVRKYGTEWHGIKRQAGTERMHEARGTPLFILLDNRNSSANEIRILSEAWPSIVHMQYFTSSSVLECINTLSHFVGQNPIYPDVYSEWGVARVVSIVQVLLQAAAKTDSGAKSLVTGNTHSTTENGAADLNATIITRDAIHIALSRGSCMPPEMLASMLQAWPKSVQFTKKDSYGNTSCPLYSVINRNPKTAQARLWQAKCIEAILQHSSLESVAIGLLRTNDGGSLQFDEVMRIISSLKSLGETRLAEGLLEAMKALLQKRDTQGKSLLHHVVVAPDFRSSFRGYETSANAKRRKYLPAGANRHIDFVRWILEQEPSLAWVCDKDGHNALHTCLQGGSTWYTGVREMVEIVPDWQCQGRKVDGLKEDLLPFQIAASAVSADGAIDTVYELLKITGPLAFSHLAFH